MKLSNSLEINNLVFKNMKFFLFPFLFTFLIIIAFVFSVSFSIKKISSQRKSLETLKKTERELNEKVSFYDSVKNQIPEHIQTLSYAYPENNSALLIISQIKRAQVELGVNMKGLKVSSSASSSKQDGVVKVNFTAQTTMDQFYPFISRLISFSPIINIDKVMMSISGETLEVDITLSSSFGVIPNKMPTAPVLSKLSDDDLTLLEEMKLLEPPSIFSLPAEENTNRVNPF